MTMCSNIMTPLQTAALTKEKIPKMLRELRKETGLPRAKVASQIGITERTLSNWEKGYNEPSISSYTALISLYEILLGRFVDITLNDIYADELK